MIIIHLSTAYNNNNNSNNNDNDNGNDNDNDNDNDNSNNMYTDLKKDLQVHQVYMDYSLCICPSIK